jgi:DNA-binding MarR family transcriptional regulator
VIDKLPKCLHTCLNCKNAAFYEEYQGPSKKIVFDGCWKIKSVKTPVDREKCDKFEEDSERVKRSFWKKWKGCIYIAAGGPGDQGYQINYDAFETACDLLDTEQDTGGPDAGPQQSETPGLENQSEGADLENQDELPALEHQQPQGQEPFIDKDTGIPDPVNSNPDTPKYIHELPDRTKAPAETKHTNIKPEPPVTPQPDTRLKIRTPTTRSLILQALSHNISNLSDIADYAGVHPSTAHYHLRNLIREERVTKISRGYYSFLNGNSSKNVSHFFEKSLNNGSHFSAGDSTITLNSIEKNILMEILSKDNKYEQFSERELAKRCHISRNTVKKYTIFLEKKKLITIKRGKNQHVFTPTRVAIHGLTAFFDSVKSGSKCDSSSSKSEPLCEPVAPHSGSENESTAGDQQVIEGTTVDGHQDIEDTKSCNQLPTGNPDQPGVMETFDEYIAWQQKNAHRLIIQFKLLRCDHNQLKKTGWIFGQKSIHKHFTEAYVFKSKDPSGEFINVLPRHPFIFTSPFEFEDKIIAFVNEAIDRLKAYGIYIDLSEPAEVKLEHVALEDNIFARKVIEKGLLYFQSKIQTIDSTGEVMEYVIAIDKSKKLHLEFEGTEAHHLTENLEAFVDDVVTGKIDRKKLREIPHKVENLKEELVNEIDTIEERLNKSIQHIEDTQKLLHQNQSDISENLVTCMEIVRKIGEASESVARTAHTIMKEVQFLTAETQGEFGKCSYLSHCS